MTSGELLDEFVTLTLRPNGAEIAWLRRQGVRGWSPLTGSIQRGNIEVHETLFDFGPNGSPAFIHPIFDGDGDVIDLIAWRPSAPSRWWLRTGIATMLGEVAVHACYVHESPLRLHRTPLNWLRRSGWGAVPLDWQCARFDLMEIADFIAEDLQHGIEIEDQLRGPARPLPRIRVPDEIRRAA